MHPKPTGRFQSAKVMANVLAEIVGGSGQAGLAIIDELSSVAGPMSRRRVEEELDSMSDVDDEEKPSHSDPSLPAQYDLFGPDSEAFGPHATQLMDEADHRYANAKGEQPVGEMDKPEVATIPVPDSGAVRDPRFKTEPSAGVAGLPPPRRAEPSAPQALGSQPSAPQALGSQPYAAGESQPSGSWQAAAALPLMTLGDTETTMMPLNNQRRWAILALCAVVVLAAVAAVLLVN
jgi:hypothetical protein